MLFSVTPFRHLHFETIANFDLHLNFHFHLLADNVVFKKSLYIGGTLSGIRIPDDLILSQSDGLQNFNVPVTFASDVKVFGTLTVGDKLNGFNLGKMCELLEPQPYAAPQKLTVGGM